MPKIFTAIKNFYGATLLTGQNLITMKTALKQSRQGRNEKEEIDQDRDRESSWSHLEFCPVETESNGLLRAVTVVAQNSQCQPHWARDWGGSGAIHKG